MADYKYAGPEVSEGVIWISDGAVIPNSVGNRDWREYVKYVYNGGETDPWVTQAELDEIAALEARVTELEAEQESVALHKYTPEQVKNYIDNISNLNDVKNALKKIAIYLLR